MPRYKLEDLNVLLIDDYRTMRRIMRNLLLQILVDENNIDELDPNGHGGTDLIKDRPDAKKYDLILFDAEMDSFPALTFLKWLREREAKHPNNGTPVLFVASSVNTHERMALLLYTHNWVIYKPFNSGTLLSKLRDIFTFDPDVSGVHN